MEILVAALTFTVLWYFRYRYDRPGAFTDLKLFTLLWIGIPRPDARLSTSHWRSHYFLRGGCYCLQCFQSALCLGLGFVYIFYIPPQLFSDGRKTFIGPEDFGWDDDGRCTSKFDDSVLKPILFPCRTSHTRIFPQKHSFSYSYLFVGIPVGWRGWILPLLTADVKSLPWKRRKPTIGWFTVDSADYLARGDDMSGLRGKLDAYLESQNEKVEDYPDAYLVTAPRFLGYSFNPVSFWYLYNGERELKAMILEVNNTFDERRIYFLKNTTPDEGVGQDQHSNTAANQTDQMSFQSQNTPVEHTPGRFTKSWPKDFHVSPFNSRKGAYALSASDPFFPHFSSMAGKAVINNTITLSSSKQHPKLVARVFSSFDSIDPLEIKKWGTIKFIAAWWWVGFVTFPRIVREAGKLFFRRKLHVWFRPEVLKDSIGRNETEDEKAVAAIFRQFLKRLVRSSDLSISLRFLPGIATMSAQEDFSPYSLRDGPNKEQRHVTFKVTTPLFYTQIARCTSIPEYVNAALSKPDPQKATFHTSHPDLLNQLFNKSSSVNSVLKKQPCFEEAAAGGKAVLSDTTALAPASVISRIRWIPIRLLRRLPPPHHGHSLSDLDACAVRLSTIDAPKARAYRKSVLKLLLSDYVAFGLPVVIDAVLWIIRIGLCGLCVQSFDGLVELYDKRGRLGVMEIGTIVLGALGVHLWWGVGELL